MRDGEPGKQIIIIRLVSDGRPEQEREAAVHSLRQWLSRESMVTGSVEVRIESLQADETNDAHFKGSPWGDIAYHVLDGTAEALATTIIAAVTAWCQHWFESHRSHPEVEITEHNSDTRNVTMVGGQDPRTGSANGAKGDAGSEGKDDSGTGEA